MTTTRPWSLSDLPDVVRIARRGRAFEDITEESGLSTNTLRRAENGEPLGMHALAAIADWTGESFLVEPGMNGQEAADEAEPVPEQEVTEPDLNLDE